MTWYDFATLIKLRLGPWRPDQRPKRTWEKERDGEGREEKGDTGPKEETGDRKSGSRRLSEAARPVAPGFSRIDAV